MAHEAGKGDKRRPCDDKAFDANYDAIFGHKEPVRGSFVWCDQQQKMIPKDEFYANRPKSDAPMIIPDIQPYKSMQTGEMITSRSKHKAHLRQHGLIEVGNEKMPERKPESYNSDEVKRTIARQLYR